MVTPTDKPEPKSETKSAAAVGGAAGSAGVSSDNTVTAEKVNKTIRENSTLLVKSILVLRFSNGKDRVCLNTNLPEAIKPDTADQLTLEFPAARGAGVEYCEKHFPGVPIELREYE